VLRFGDNVERLFGVYVKSRQFVGERDLQPAACTKNKLRACAEKVSASTANGSCERFAAVPHVHTHTCQIMCVCVCVCVHMLMRE